MTLLRLEQLQLAYGTQVLLDRADLTVERGERLALVGRNGTGKSTLLKLVAGDIQPDDGTIWRAPGLKDGVLAQELPESSGMTIFDMVAQGLPEAGELLSEYQHLINDPDPDMNRMATLQTRLEAIDGWSFHQRIDVVLTRLGLPPEAEMSALSGGWARYASGRAFSAQRSESWLSWMQPTAERTFTALPVAGWLGLPGAGRNRAANVSMTVGGCAFAGTTGMSTTLK